MGEIIQPNESSARTRNIAGNTQGVQETLQQEVLNLLVVWLLMALVQHPELPNDEDKITYNYIINKFTTEHIKF